MSYREINLGKILTGMSSYEMAVAKGMFIGTEDEYVRKEQDTYDQMVKYGDDLRAEMASITNNPNRLNHLGVIEDSIALDNIFSIFHESEIYSVNPNNTLSYSCVYGTGLVIGHEGENSGIQFRISMTDGLMTRQKVDNQWTEWDHIVTSKGGQ